MKHEAWRRIPDAYPLRSEIPPRYTDVDLWQHLNNVALIGLQGESVMRWLRSQLGEGFWKPTRPALAPFETQTDFIAEAYYPEPLQLGTRLMAVGPDGLRLASALFQAGRCVGLHEAAVGLWQQGLRLPLDDALCAQLMAIWRAQPPLPPVGPAPEALATGDTPAQATHAGHAAPAAAAAPPDEPAPLPPEAHPQPFTLPLRFGDHDGQGQVSDFALARFAEQSRVQLLDRLMGAGRLEAAVGFMVAHVGLRWQARGRGPLALRAGCGVGRIGERSLTVRTAFFDDTRCLAQAESVMVVIHRDSRQPMRMPEAVRAAAMSLAYPAS